MASKTDSNSLFQHFNADEKVFVEKMLDKIDQVQTQYAIALTPFLNPRERDITVSLVKRAGLQVYSSDLLMPTEFCRLLIAADYYVLEERDFEIQLLELQYARKFNTLTHSQILGNLVNQLGIQRHLLGDIILGEETTQIVLDAKLSQLVIQHITRLSRVPVTWREVPYSKLVMPNEVTSIKQLLTTSLRLDSLIASAYNLSRQEASKLIEQHKVKLNHQLMENPSYSLKIGDLVSCRGFGRFKIDEDNGLTRHGKHKLVITKIGGK
ncbi:YlmH family RNA-binding protein [Streptococcus moroccensis]|uniref:RNA-binding protein YlmH n=1 Tax=Streptococcus moroccensis TaxID=1451356 RepID=A0ABT9YNC0_9STRE|nr:YlmH/Sll1252 family protein [Streptococcus moroccensis]MDQ0221485.1 RNA-binding protein YlmH [Streptococcus moroccensis]